MFLIASGDLRLSANQTCWPAQADRERPISVAFAAEGITVRRAHPYDETLKQGFIWNQRMGMDVFKFIPPEAPLIVAVAIDNLEFFCVNIVHPVHLLYKTRRLSSIPSNKSIISNPTTPKTGKATRLCTHLPYCGSNPRRGINFEETANS